MYWNSVVSGKPKKGDWIDVVTGSDVKLIYFFSSEECKTKVLILDNW